MFADDLAELQQWPLPTNLQQLDAQGRSFLVTHQGTKLRLEIYPDRGVVRLSRNGASPAVSGEVSGAVAGGTVGTAIAEARRQKGDGLLGGVLLGLLIGALLGGAAGEARRVFALMYDHASGQWRAYDGGLLRWMKAQLAVHAG